MRTLIALLSLLPLPALADATVWLGTGEHGEPVFSDHPLPGSQPVAVHTPAPADPDAAATSAAQAEQWLALAERLAAERRKERAARLIRPPAPAPAPSVVVVEQPGPIWRGVRRPRPPAPVAPEVSGPGPLFGPPAFKPYPPARVPRRTPPEAPPRPARAATGS